MTAVAPGTGTIPLGHVDALCHRASPEASCGHAAGATAAGVGMAGSRTRSCVPSLTLCVPTTETAHRHGSTCQHSRLVCELTAMAWQLILQQRGHHYVRRLHSIACSAIIVWHGAGCGNGRARLSLTFSPGHPQQAARLPCPRCTLRFPNMMSTLCGRLARKRRSFHSVTARKIPR